ncbi:hypothetical protein E3Q22_02996 [Wallemia mellicola]|uniref:Uncharacterized protein n=2 Tax=Wallemia mellicola TaxID=1708541 RepID=A0A4T0M4D5_9BASI|nr:hypothetical protein E3Q22_02996 [Wallemia mellicola]TIB98766.1 hypothetical protein E3Q17_02869 [Wallemia mellicola]
MDIFKNIKDIGQSLINSPITGVQQVNEDYDQAQSEVPQSSSMNEEVHKRVKKYAQEVLVIVRPPPHISNNPMNLQIQLVTPKSNRQSMASDSNLSRSSSLHSSHSLGQASNLSLHSTTSQSQFTAGGRKLIPLYNLQYHNVLTTAITDAGTDAKIAKFTKRGLEILNLIGLESDLLSSDNASTTSKKFTLDGLFKFGKNDSKAPSELLNHDEYSWLIRKLLKSSETLEVTADDLQFTWKKSSESNINSRRSSIPSQPASEISHPPSEIDREDDETPWSFYAISKHFNKIHLGTLHPAPHHPRIVGQLKVPFPLPDIPVPNTNQKLSPEDLKDILSCTCLWLVTKEEFGGLDKRRKGDGWRIT